MSIIDNVHQSVKTKIDANVSGYAQAYIDEVKVSYDGSGFSYGPDLFSEYPGTQIPDLIYFSFAVAIAARKGEGTADVFSEARLARLAHKAEATKVEKQVEAAKLVESFYLSPGGPGVFMVR